MSQLPKIVRDRLAGAPAAVVNSHPDPDLLTAFVEGAIGGRERDHVLTHLAACPDCREVVTLASPEFVPDQQRVAAAVPVKARWWGVSSLRWAAVSATAVIVLGAVLLVRPSPRSQKGILLPSNTISNVTASLDKQTRADAEAKASPEKKALTDEKAVVVAAPKQSEVGLAADYEDREKLRGANLDKLQAREEVHAKPQLTSPQPNTSMVTENIVAPPRYQSGALAKSAGLPPPAAAPAAQAGTGHVGGVSRGAVAGASVAVGPRATETVEVAAGAPTVNTNTGLQSDKRQNQGDEQKVEADIAEFKVSKEKKDQMNLDAMVSSSQDIARKPARAAGAGAGVGSGSGGGVGGGTFASTGRPAAELMTTPTSIARMQLPPARWTIDAAGNLQRSLDLGKSWQTVPVERGAHLQALAVLQQELWAGGNQGALYHSSDGGTHWTRVRPTVGDTALADDITRISLLDPQHLTITTSSSETWSSTDGGQTWRKQ
jgi:Photosynthesis system II assembly factor YCF48/Putative zinc-finger